LGLSRDQAHAGGRDATSRDSPTFHRVLCLDSAALVRAGMDARLASVRGCRSRRFGRYARWCSRDNCDSTIERSGGLGCAFFLAAPPVLAQTARDGTDALNIAPT
jgi:hypothetical protein